MKQSGLLKRQRAREYQTSRGVGTLVMQYMQDTAHLALHEMGWGYDRIMRFNDIWREMQREYKESLNEKNPEYDVVQEHMDRALKDILKDRKPLIPFRDRYPEMKDKRY